MTLTLGSRERRWLSALVVATVALRLATLGAYPLMDATESRYAEIARKMLETGNWITPQFDYGVPFWAKPPLSTWLTAASMALFGVNEHAARLPALLLLLGVGALVWRLARERGGNGLGLWSVALFSTTVLPFVAAGTAMTDPALALGTTLSMMGFWNAVAGPERGRRAGGIAFFAGIAVGLLAKGPVALVLTFAPLVGWTWWTRRWRDAARRLPWLVGTLLTAALVVPWYWIAELRTPGFLEYFLLGEHWHRFLDSGWKGDRYGAAHAHPRGLIWGFAVAALLPWSLDALGAVGRAIVQRKLRLGAFLADPWRAYLLFWALAPMLFFTFAGNILWTYVLPGAPAFALLVADGWRPHDDADRPVAEHGMRARVLHLLAVGAIVPLVFVLGIAVLRESFATAHSHKALVRDYEARRGESHARLVYFLDPPPSAEFYAHGKAVRTDDPAMLMAHLDDPIADFVAIRDNDLPKLPERYRSLLESVGTYGEYRLLREAPR